MVDLNIEFTSVNATCLEENNVNALFVGTASGKRFLSVLKKIYWLLWSILENIQWQMKVEQNNKQRRYRETINFNKFDKKLPSTNTIHEMKFSDNSLIFPII